MKRIIFGATMIALFGMSSCQEAQDIREIENDVLKQGIRPQLGAGRLFIFVEGHASCFPAPVDCLDDVIIYPRARFLYDNLLNDIKDDKAEQFFSKKDWKILLPTVSDEMAKAASEKEILVEVTQYEGGNKAILFKSKDSKLLLAVPMILETEK